jgi:leucyl-tRNA synthetase
VTRDDKGRILTAVLKADGRPVIPGGVEKMSKSKNNGVDPQALIDRFGADTVRLYTMFTAPPEQSLEWSDEGVEGAHRFLKRVWNLAMGQAERLRKGPADLSDLPSELKAIRREIHNALRKALFDYERQQFNTVVSACMAMVNSLGKVGEGKAARAVLHEGMGMVLRLLAPIAPHVTHHLWLELGFGADILEGGWPQVDEAALEQAQVEYVVQINGKLRGRVRVAADADRDAVAKVALANENVHKFVGTAEVRNIVLVPGKLINIVVR